MQKRGARRRPFELQTLRSRRERGGPRKRSPQVLPRKWIMTRSFGIAWGAGLTYPDLREGRTEEPCRMESNTHTHTHILKRCPTWTPSIIPYHRSALSTKYVVSPSGASPSRSVFCPKFTTLYQLTYNLRNLRKYRSKFQIQIVKDHFI